MEVPYRVEKSEGNTFVIEKDDRSVEHMSRTRVVLSPTPLTTRETQDIVRPMTDEELEKDYPAKDSLPQPRTRIQAKFQFQRLENIKEPEDGASNENITHPKEDATQSKTEDSDTYTIDLVFDHHVN